MKWVWLLNSANCLRRFVWRISVVIGLVPQIAPRSQGTQLAEYDREIDEQLQSLQVHDGEGKEAWLRPQRAEIRSAHAIVQDVRG